MLASVTEARTDLGSTVRYWAEERPDGIALDDGVTRISYRELQSDASGVLNDRRATAVLERQASGALLWRHLHETFC